MAFPLKKLISSFLPIFSPTTIVNLSEPPCVRYKSIISFGDSSADTGNFLSLSDDINHPPQAAFLPYGETFFHPPSGRYFDCRLIIDFIAEFLAVEDPGLNFIWVKPCKKKSKVSTVGFETGFKLLEVSQREFDQQSYWYFNVNPYKTYIYPNLTCVMCNPILSSGSATGSWDNLIYVPPYFGSKSVSFDQGVKFAVYGATALDRALLVEKELNLISPMLVEVFSLTSSRKFCLTFAPRLLVRGVRRLADTHGRVGVNDYNYPFFEGESINEIKELVPLVIKAISSAIVELIDLGGKTFLVPGNFPLGCFPAYLTLFETSEKEHDPFTGCIPWLNDFGEYHNEQLKTELTQLQKLYPHVC